jgi:hypothetical protein
MRLGVTIGEEEEEGAVFLPVLPYLVGWEGLVGTVGHCDPWQGRFISWAACLMLTNSSSSILPIFFVDPFLLVDGTHLGINKHPVRFF